jgi:transcriptional regulator with XRE-family HTH domain
MTVQQLKAIRQRLGLTQGAFAQALGYTGYAPSLAVQISRYENGTRPIPPGMALLVEKLSKGD